MAIDLPDVHYDQLIITKDMIPSADLGINGDYGRHLIIPDDVLNTLSHIVVPQNGKPRLATMNDDGGVNVHLVNSGGGGTTGFSSAKYVSNASGWFNFSAANGNTIQATVFATMKYLHGVHCSVQIDSTNVAAMVSGTVEVYLTPSSGLGTFPIFIAGFTVNPNGTPLAPTAVSHHVLFVPAVDILATFGSGAQWGVNNSINTPAQVSLSMNFS